MTMMTLAARAMQIAQLNLFFAQTGMTTLAQRRLQGPRKPNWSWRFESAVRVMAGLTPNHADILVDEIRTPFDRVTEIPVRHKVRVEPVQIGGVPGEWVSVAQADPTHVLLYLHGGGYISGSPHTYRMLIAEIARVTQMRVLAPDYRLAPENPYPAAVEDAQTAYFWLLEQGIAPENIVVAGDSAGGGLTVALMLTLRESGAPLPACGVCLSPWFDLTMAGESIRANAGLDYLNEHMIRAAVQMYIQDHDPHEPLISPLYADLHGLPPLLIQAGTVDLLFDDAKRFAQRAKAAGVDITLELAENMVHVFQFFYLVSPEARQAIQQIGHFVRDHIDQKTKHARPLANSAR